jgi:hypothetical protein
MVTIPDEMIPLARQLAAIHANDCRAQASMIERTFGAGHPHHAKARQILAEAQALQHVFAPAQRVAA